jgi:hypothetical protein
VIHSCPALHDDEDDDGDSVVDGRHRLQMFGTK